MQEINNIKSKIKDMSKLCLSMWQTTFRAFMEHNLDLFSKILETENKLNEFEKEIVANLVELGKDASKKDEKAKVAIYADIVGDLELIGDYCKDILERVHIKIEEKLLFSDDAVKEYTELYRKTEEALQEVVYALDKDKPSLVKEVLNNAQNIDNLLNECRRRHNQRLIDGICSPFACNMFLNMLDFTGQIFHHTKSIAENLLRLK
jgi:phosphate:Na+ symporter